MTPKVQRLRLFTMTSLAVLVALMPSTIRGFSSTPSSYRSYTSYITRPSVFSSHRRNTSLLMSTESETSEDGSIKNPFVKGNKGKILVLGGSGFLGNTVARRAILEGYSVTSLSRRGRPSETSSNPSPDLGTNISDNSIEYIIGDARDKSTIESILNKEEYMAVVHCIGLLFDGESGLGNYNRLVSGSGSVPEEASNYDDITRKTSFNAIEAAEDHAETFNKDQPMPFIFTSAAEAGWPDVNGGKIVEKYIAPQWLKRYLVAKRSVESRLDSNPALIRPVIFRPSLIYSLDRVASLPPVGAFFVGNKLGLPFVDRPVTVQALSCAIIRSLNNSDAIGVQRFMDIDKLSA